MKKRTWKTRGRKRSEEAGRTFAGYQKKSERYVAMNGPIFSLERSKGTTHRNLGVLLPFLLDPPKSLEVTASRSTWCIPFVASSFRFAPDNDSPRIQKPRNNLFQTSIIRCYPEREKIWPAETCSGSGRNYRGGYAPAPPSEGTGWTPLGVSISMSFIWWKRTVSLAIEEFTRIEGFFLPSIDKIIVFRDASTCSPWRIETGFAIRKCELIVFSLLNGIFSFFSSSSILMKVWMLRDSFFFFFKNWLITINFETVWFIDSSKECFKVLFFFKYWFYRCVFKYYRRRKEEFKMKSRIYLKK